jgi:HK97 family phage prohead protease
MSIQATRRMVTEGGLEIRSDSTSVTVEGYASTFDQPYNMGWYQETVARGAFDRTLKSKPDVRFLVNHDGLPLARTKSVPENLTLSTDSTGLGIRAILDATDPDVRRLVPKMKRGDLDQMSFAFGIVAEEWSDDNKNRNLTELSLTGGDVSIVTYPANPNASIALRARQLVDENGDQLRETHARLSSGEAGLEPVNARRMMSLIEGLYAADETGDDSLTELTALLGTGVRAEVEAVIEVIESGRPVEDIKSLITKARAKSRG